MRRYPLVMALMGVVLLAAGVGCLKTVPAADDDKPRGSAADQAAAPPVVVTAAPVTYRRIQRTVQVVGTFHGTEEVTIVPKAAGRVVRIHHDVGDVVRPGEVLLELDDTDPRLAADEAAKALESELSKLGLVQLASGEFEVADLPMVTRARLLADNARRKLRRCETLLARQVTTQDEFDQAQTDYRVAQANYEQSLIDARATLAAARHRQAMLATAEQRLRDTRVVVPTPSAPAGDGHFVVAARMVSEGEMVQSQPGTEVFRLVIDHPLKLKAAVPERYVGDLKVDQAAEVFVEAYPGQAFPGRVARIHPTIDPVNRTFQIEVQVANAARQLRPGNFAKAAILTREEARAATIPEESLVTFAGVRKVYVIREGKAAAVEVQTGVRGDDWLEVHGDLGADAQVITSGATHLADGTPVRLRDASGGGGAAAPQLAREPRGIHGGN